MARTYISPASVNDVSSVYTNEANTIDFNSGTYATTQSAAGWLEFTPLGPDAFLTNYIKVKAKAIDYGGDLDAPVRIEGYIGGQWVAVYVGNLTKLTEIEIGIPLGFYEKFRLRFTEIVPTYGAGYLYEFQICAVWVCPASTNDPSEIWSDEASAIDRDSASYAYTGPFLTHDYLEFIPPGGTINSEALRFAASVDALTNPKVSVDVYYSGAWHNLLSQVTINAGQWRDMELDSFYDITKGRIIFHDLDSSSYHARVYGFQFANEYFSLDSTGVDNGVGRGIGRGILRGVV